MIGVELGGALKNVIALCAGVLDGMKMGDNAKAALMTRGMTEISRLGARLGAKRETFFVCFKSYATFQNSVQVLFLLFLTR